MALRLVRRASRASGAALALLFFACATKPKPAPAPPADDAELLASSLTRYFSLDSLQQERTRQFARELVARDAAIRAGWDRGEKVRPEMLFASRARFEAEFSSILTAEQRRRYEQEWLRLKGLPRRPAS